MANGAGSAPSAGAHGPHEPSRRLMPDRNPEPALPVRRIAISELLRGAREIEIEHAGRIYRLRLTSLGKLILTA
jgi:hemin uptake protein HemP